MKNILISTTDEGMVTALVENGKLLEFLQDFGDESLAGNIYVGMVKKVTGGFIFLDIGGERQAFLDTKDGRERRRFPPGKPPARPGDTMVVQVLKDAVGTKGPNVSSSVAYTGRYIMIFESLDADKVNVSKKIVDYDESKRLKKIAQKSLSPGFSAIIRSAAEFKSEEYIEAEIEMLMERWSKFFEWQQMAAPAALWAQSGIIKTLMEILQEDVDEIIVDNPEVFEIVQSEFTSLYPDFTEKVRLHEKPEPIFNSYFVKPQIDKINEKRVWLKSGGFIVIEQTEACVVVDVNTGKFQSKGGETAKLALNLEAATEIAYQLRLRNLSGIVIIDFLRMQSKQDTQRLLEYLEMELHKDRIPALLVGITALGLVEVTRKRVRKPVTSKK
ncbi:MAG: ribonuclease E/G [Defluviitaleaceae bacterium]|nr:ribonuclease E/G [Defluviitaleaceae bacterium]